MTLIKTLIGITILFASPALAANLSAKAAGDIGAQVTSAYLTASQVERQLENTLGDPLTPALINGLNVVDQAAANAETLANGDAHLEPGLKHVRVVIRKIKDEAKVSPKGVGLIGEALIELYPLMVNAAIIEAASHLESAANALDKGKSKEVIFYLEHAVNALKTANERGAYHLQNDVEHIEAALSEIAEKVDSQVPVSRDSIDERIEEINSHLFHVGEGE